MAANESITTDGVEMRNGQMSPYEAVERYFAKDLRGGQPETQSRVNTNNLWMRIACGKGLYGKMWKENQYDKLPHEAKAAIRQVEDRHPEMIQAVLAYSALRETKDTFAFDKWAAKPGDQIEVTEDDFNDRVVQYVDADGLEVVNAKLKEAEEVIPEMDHSQDVMAAKRLRFIHYAGSAIMDDVFDAMNETVPMRPEIAVALVK